MCVSQIFRDEKSRSPGVKNFMTEENVLRKANESLQELTGAH